jgi:hypothetical protein
MMQRWSSTICFDFVSPVLSRRSQLSSRLLAISRSNDAMPSHGMADDTAL